MHPHSRIHALSLSLSALLWLLGYRLPKGHYSVTPSKLVPGADALCSILVMLLLYGYEGIPVGKQVGEALHRYKSSVMSMKLHQFMPAQELTQNLACLESIIGSHNLSLLSIYCLLPPEFPLRDIATKQMLKPVA